MPNKVFIDGDVGTTGLNIRKRLELRTDIELVRIDEASRKDVEARRDAINNADVVILCLPDEAARQAVGLVENEQVKIIDASTAHRVDEDWAYGFAELTKGHRDEIRSSKRITNPGCYATGYIAMMRPLVEAGLVPPFWPSTCHAVSGYSGGGKSMIDEFTKPLSDGGTDDAFRIYATGLNHKHLPEMTVFSGLESPPVFSPSVGRFAQGMIVEIPLQLWALPEEPELSQIHEILSDFYAGEVFVKVASLDKSRGLKTLQPQMLNGTNQLLINVFGDELGQQARLVAVLDNLGKGASGAAVQNLNLLLGFDETIGLT